MQRAGRRISCSTCWPPLLPTHYYRDFSHVMDTLAKAAELLDIIGWEHAQAVLPALTSQWRRRRGKRNGMPGFVPRISLRLWRRQRPS